MNPIMDAKRTIIRSGKSLKNIRTIAFSAILAALYAILMTPFLGNIPVVFGVIEIRFGYLILATAGMILGPTPAVLVAFVGDIVGTILFYGGDFFFGYTILWMFQAFVFGLIFYSLKNSRALVVTAMIFQTLVINLLFTSMIQTFMGSSRYSAVLISRIPMNLILFVPKALLLYFTLQGVKRVLQKLPYQRIN